MPLILESWTILTPVRHASLIAPNMPAALANELDGTKRVAPSTPFDALHLLIGQADIARRIV